MSDSFSSKGGQPETQNLTFTDDLLGGQPWLDKPENGPTFFPEPPLAQDEPAVIKNFDPERQPKLDFVLPAISQTDTSAKPTPPPERPRPRFHDPELVDAQWEATDDGLFEFDEDMRAEVSNRIGIAHWAGESVEETASLYPILRAQYGHEVLGNYDITEIDLDRHFRDDAKFKKELEIAVADIPGRLVEGYISDIIWNKTTPVPSPILVCSRPCGSTMPTRRRSSHHSPRKFVCSATTSPRPLDRRRMVWSSAARMRRRSATSSSTS